MVEFVCSKSNSMQAIKTIYLIRHGESVGNAGTFRQDGLSPLTEKGILQSTHLAQRMKSLPIEVIVSSSMVRAKQTALILSQGSGKNVISSNLFIERRRPSAVIGRSKTDLDVNIIEKAIQTNFTTLNWRHSDEDNFEDLKQRAQLGLSYLADRSESHIAVISHKYFSRVMLGVVLFGDSFSAHECVALTNTFTMANTGILILKLDLAHKRWKIDAWNAHGHVEG
jgi:broad specificity phosphatase PhoE